MPLWYMIAYDIRDPVRLRRVHAFLARRALALQQSVFAIHADPAGLNEVLDDLARLIERNQDDVRAYPISRPADLWWAGHLPVSGALLHPATEPVPRPGGLRRLLHRFWSANHGR